MDLKKVIAKLQKKLEAAREQAEQMLAERSATEPEPSDEPAKPKVCSLRFHELLSEPL